MDEFEFISDLKRKYSLDKVGDDAAVLPGTEALDRLITTDLLVENVDFTREWMKPRYLGRKALAVSVSDILAMGGYPKWALTSLGIPGDLWDSGFADDFYAGWHEVAREFGVTLIGGDLSRSETLVIDSTVIGEVPKGTAWLRSGAEPGDLLWVSGDLGGAAGGLKLLERGFEILDDHPDLANDLLLRQLAPSPQVDVVKSLRALNIVTAMIDVSDGLSSDLTHLCRASSVGANIYSESIPTHPDLNKYFHSEDSMEMALSGGEDYALLFTTRSGDRTQLADLPVHLIGEITELEAGIQMMDKDGPHPLTAEGFKHF